jgi:hypothetical protein
MTEWFFKIVVICSPESSCVVIEAPFVQGERWSILAAWLTTMATKLHLAVEAFKVFKFII